MVKSSKAEFTWNDGVFCLLFHKVVQKHRWDEIENKASFDWLPSLYIFGQKYHNRLTKVQNCTSIAMQRTDILKHGAELDLKLNYLVTEQYSNRNGNKK